MNLLSPSLKTNKKPKNKQIKSLNIKLWLDIFFLFNYKNQKIKLIATKPRKLIATKTQNDEDSFNSVERDLNRYCDDLFINPLFINGN